MQLAFCLYKYFPFGGLQRDFLRIALTCQARGHDIRVYALEWDGEVPPGFELVRVPVKAFTNHGRYAKFTDWVQADLRRRPADRIVGFNKMPGLDVYYAADPCYEDKARNLRKPLYRFSPRYRHFSAYERAVFAPEVHTEILTISPAQQALFAHYYGTPQRRCTHEPSDEERARFDLATEQPLCFTRLAPDRVWRALQSVIADGAPCEEALCATPEPDDGRPVLRPALRPVFDRKAR